MNKLFGSLLAITALSASAASAGYSSGNYANNPWPNWYIGIQGSIPFIDESDVEINSSRVGNLDFDSGYGVGVSLGYKPGPTNTFFDNTRFEIEYYYRDNELDELDGAAFADDVSSSSYMVNAYYDIDIGSSVVPYVGAGIGMTEIELNVPSLQISDEDNVFAYQLMAGIGWQPENLLNTVLHLGYRYFDASDPSLDSNDGNRLEHEYRVHSIEAGARFRF